MLTRKIPKNAEIRFLFVIFYLDNMDMSLIITKPYSIHLF